MSYCSCMACLSQVLLPYLRSKADRIYKLHANQGLLGLALGRAAAQEQPSSGARQHQLRAAAVRLFVAAYPSFHAVMEGSVLAWHMAYLLGKAPAHSPVLQSLGMKLGRVSAQDLVSYPWINGEAARWFLFERLGTPCLTCIDVMAGWNRCVWNGPSRRHAVQSFRQPTHGVGQLRWVRLSGGSCARCTLYQITRATRLSWWCLASRCVVK